MSLLTYSCNVTYSSTDFDQLPLPVDMDAAKSRELTKLVSSLLLEQEAWSPAVRIWGEPEELAVEQAASADGRTECRIATDVRIFGSENPQRSLLSTLFGKLSLAGFIVTNEDGKRLKSFAELVADALSSDAASFVKNPQEYLIGRRHKSE